MSMHLSLYAICTTYTMNHSAGVICIGVETGGALGARAPTNFWMGGQCPHKAAMAILQCSIEGVGPMLCTSCDA